MPALGQVARAQARGERNPHVGYTDPLENRGWAVWYAVRNGVVRVKGKSTPGPIIVEKGIDLSGVDGFEVEINLTTKMKDMWKELAQADQLTKNTFTAEIRQYLTKSGNMICLRSPGLAGKPGAGAQGQPVWWVRGEWNDVKALGIYRQTTLTSAERRLTPQEAGEDRPPAPVEIRHLDKVGESAEQEALNETREDTERRIAERHQSVIDVLEQAEYPLYQSEIAERAGITNWMAGRAVRDLVAEDAIYRRYETSEERSPSASGRYHYLYWPQADIPKRDPSLYKVSMSVMDRINAMKPGDSMTTKWMSGGVMREVQELVDAGILVMENGRIMLAPETSVESVADVVEETAPEPTPLERIAARTPQPTYTGMEAVGKAVAELVEAEVQRRMADMAGDTERVAELEALLARENERARIAETNLSNARAELLTLREKFDAARAAFGL